MGVREEELGKVSRCPDKARQKFGWICIVGGGSEIKAKERQERTKGKASSKSVCLEIPKGCLFLLISGAVVTGGLEETDGRPGRGKWCQSQSTRPERFIPMFWGTESTRMHTNTHMHACYSLQLIFYF